MPKVSIIVPVYKTEKFIRECLESILQQTFTAWECLLIDDGSPDNSGKICDEYAKKDTRFRVFHEENCGVSHARNIGLDNMLGDWVMFVDSDDMIAPTTLQQCMNLVNQNDLDIVQFSYSRQMYNNTDLLVTTPPMTIAAYIKSGKYLVCVGGSLCKSNIVKENSIQFDTSIALAEDQIFMYEYFKYSRYIQRIETPLYFYRVNESGAVHSSNSIDMIRSAYKLIEYKQKFPAFEHRINRILMMFIETIINNNDIPPKKIWELYVKMNVHESSELTRRSTVFYFISKFSFRLAHKILKFYRFGR